MKNWIVPEFQRSETKQPSETVKVTCDFSVKVSPYFGRLTSATFSAVKWPISDPDLKTDGSDIFAEGSSAVIEAPYLTHAKILVAAGEENFDYHVTCIAVTDDGQTIEQDFFIRIREL